MFDKLSIFQTAMTMARHAGLKQAVTSENVANSDTPGYQARIVQDFSDIVGGSMRPASVLPLKTSHPSHYRLGQPELGRIADVGTNSEPSGNSVVLETEIINSVAAKRQHERALAVYRASLDMLRGALSTQ